MSQADRIGLKLRSIREAKGYSQEYMAEMLDISQSTYACLESGKTSLRVDRLLQILEILDTDIVRLLQDDSPPEAIASFPKISLPEAEVKMVYEKMITEMKEEITFLRNLVRNQ